MASHQAPLSLGFSSQEHWSGLPFPSPMRESESEVAQSCPILSNPMDCSLSGSSVHGIFQARLLEWGAIAFSACYAYGQLNPVSSSWSLVRAELKSHCVLSVLDFAVSLLPFILLALQLRCLCVCSSGLAQESGAPGSSCICFFVVQVMHSVINYLLCLWLWARQCPSLSWSGPREGICEEGPKAALLLGGQSHRRLWGEESNDWWNEDTVLLHFFCLCNHDQNDTLSFLVYKMRRVVPTLKIVILKYYTSKEYQKVFTLKPFPFARTSHFPVTLFFNFYLVIFPNR